MGDPHLGAFAGDNCEVAFDTLRQRKKRETIVNVSGALGGGGGVEFREIGSRGLWGRRGPFFDTNRQDAGKK